MKKVLIADIFIFMKFHAQLSLSFKKGFITLGPEDILDPWLAKE